MNATATANEDRTAYIARIAADMTADQLLAQYALAFIKYNDKGDADSGLLVTVISAEIKSRMAGHA